MSKNDNYPIFSLTNIVSKTKQNKQNTAVESKPLGYREHKKQVQQRQQKAIHDTKVWLGLIPETQPQFKGDKKWGRKNTQWGKKPWQQAKRINVKWQSKGWVQKKFHVKKKFDRFAKQKQWLKE
jgi:hypothetical protein